MVEERRKVADNFFKDSNISALSFELFGIIPVRLLMRQKTSCVSVYFISIYVNSYVDLIFVMFITYLVCSVVCVYGC